MVLQDSSSGQRKIILDSTCSVFLFDDVLVFALLSDSGERKELASKEENTGKSCGGEVLYIIRKILHLSILSDIDEKENESLEQDNSYLMFEFPRGRLALFGEADLLKKWSKRIWEYADSVARRDFDYAQGNQGPTSFCF